MGVMLFCVFIVLWVFIVCAQGSDNLKKQVKIKELKVGKSFWYLSFLTVT